MLRILKAASSVIYLISYTTRIMHSKAGGFAMEDRSQSKFSGGHKVTVENSRSQYCDPSHRWLYSG